MQLSKIYRGQYGAAIKRLEFQEFDVNGELPEGTWTATAAVEFTPELLSKETVAGPRAETSIEADPADPVAKRDFARDQQELELRLQSAFAEGRLAGLQEAATAAVERFDQVIDALGLALEDVSQLRERLLRDSRADMVRLVMAIARQVIHVEVSVNRDTVLSTIDRALQSAVRADAYQINVHPDDLLQATEKKPLFLASISSLKNISFQANAAVALGGCLVESELGEVDATIDSQL